MNDKNKLIEIEPKIKPLVDALNKVPFIQTFSACQGHFSKKEIQEDPLDDRGYAEVRFFTTPDLPDEEILETFINILLTSFYELYAGCGPVYLRINRCYTPDFEKDAPGFNYAIELRLWRDVIGEESKRKALDVAISDVVGFVEDFVVAFCE